MNLPCPQIQQNVCPALVQLKILSQPNWYQYSGHFLVMIDPKLMMSIRTILSTQIRKILGTNNIVTKKFDSQYEQLFKKLVPCLKLSKNTEIVANNFSCHNQYRKMQKSFKMFKNKTLDKHLPFEVLATSLHNTPTKIQ